MIGVAPLWHELGATGRYVAIRSEPMTPRKALQDEAFRYKALLVVIAGLRFESRWGYQCEPSKQHRSSRAFHFQIGQISNPKELLSRA